MSASTKKNRNAQYATLRVFVSFSSRDTNVGDLVRLLWHRLSEQSIEIFNYERPAGEILPGQTIEQACKTELEQATHCFVVISEAAFTSSWTQLEVEYALYLNRTNYLLPIVLTTNRNWPPPYNQLKGVKSLFSLTNKRHLSADMTQDIVERIILKFCSNNHIRYISPNTDLPRLPLRRKIIEEIYALDGGSQSQRSRDMEILFHRCERINKFVLSGKLDLAIKQIDRIIEDMEDLFEITNPYYPKIVRTVFAIQQLEGSSNHNHTLLESLREETETLITRSRASVDANAFALLGNIELLLGNPENALHCFEKAEDYLTKVDPALVHNKILATILTGRRDNLESLLNMLDKLSLGAPSAEPGNLARIHIMHAIALCYKGNIREAVEKFPKGEAIRNEDFDIIRQYLDEAPEQAKQMRDETAFLRVLDLISAIEPISKFFSLDHWVSVAQRKAFMALELGNKELAVHTMKNILSVSNFKHSVQLLTDATLIFHASGMNEEAAQFASHALLETRLAAQPIPISESDFEYYRGLAAWLLSKNEVAQDCYLRAGGDKLYKWYEKDYNWVSRALLYRHHH